MRRETEKPQNLGLLKWIIPELRVLALTKRHLGSGNEIGKRFFRESGYFSACDILSLRWIENDGLRYPLSYSLVVES